MDTLPTTRGEARAAGARHYFTGKPCSHGHIALRHLTGTCTECGKRAAREWQGRNPELGNARSKRWREANPELSREVSVRSKRKAMGIPSPTRGCPPACECCGRTLERGKVHLDHCHITGIFRGWLCNRCNLSLGHLGDNVDGVKKALRYLERAYSMGTQHQE